MMKYRRIRRRSSKMSEDDRRREDGSSSSSSSPHSDPTALATMTYSVARDKTGSGAGSSRSSPPLPAPPLLPSAALALTLLLTLVLSPATAVAAAASSGGGNPPMVQRTTTSARGRSGAFVHRWRCSPPPPSSSLPRGQLIGGTVSNPAGSCPHRRGVPAGRRRLGPPPVVLVVVSSPTSSRRDIEADDDGGGGGGEGARRRQLRRGKRGGGGRGRNDEAEAPPPPFRVLSSVVVRDVPIPVLAHYLRDAFRLPTDLPMPYERAASSSATGTITNGEGGETSAAGIASWICTIYPDDTLLAAEIVAIRTDGEGDDDDDDGGGEDAQGDGVSPPRMAMVAVKSYRPADGGGMGGSRSLVDAAEGDVVRALERGLDELQNRPELQRRLRDEVCRGADVGGGSSPASNGVAGGEIADGRGNGSPSAIGWGIDGSDGGGGREGRKVPASMRHAGVDDRNGAASAGSSSAAVRPDVIVDVESVTADDADPPSSPAQRSADASSGASSGTYSTTTERDVNLDVGGDRDGKLTRPEAGEGEEGRELTSEELLKEVLRFGDEEAQRDREGAGFARGAFDEAKELLRRRRQTQSEVPPVGPAATRLEYGYADDDGADSPKAPKPPPDFLSRRSVDDAAGGDTDDPREELRRIFEAGRELAEGRITSSVVGAAGATSPLSRDNSDNNDDDDDVDVDALIASDRTVPAGARSIEDELAELEVRIGRDPGDDDRDGRPVFDLFSGPTPGGDETVDPATAVNWPGAAAGTREVRLHPELQEAVDNAKFAAKMLAELREEEGEGGATRYYVGRREVPVSKVDKLRKCVGEAVDVGIIDDPLEEMEERARLAMLLDELADQPEDRYEDITSGYKELLLSDRFVSLVRDRLDAMAGRDSRKTSGVDDSASDVAPTEGLSKDEKERSNLGKLTKSAMLLLKEAQQLGAELEAMQLETIRSICQVAMDPSHRTEEEAAIALSDAVRDMRPLLDDNLVAYLKYAISEEEGRLARRGHLDDPDHNSWLFVLKIVQQGVYAELGRALQRHTDSLWFVLRMESKSERRLLLEKLVDDLPSLDVRPFRKVVDNIVSSLGAGVRGDFDTDVIGGMTKKLLQLASDIKEVLPPEKIKRKSKDADEWAAQQRERIREMQQEKRQRLVAGREERAADGAMISGRGEIERI